jgi:hypothetical protein
MQRFHENEVHNMWTKCQSWSLYHSSSFLEDATARTRSLKTVQAVKLRWHTSIREESPYGSIVDQSSIKPFRVCFPQRRLHVGCDESTKDSISGLGSGARRGGARFFGRFGNAFFWFIDSAAASRWPQIRSSGKRAPRHRPLAVSKLLRPASPCCHF